METSFPFGLSMRRQLTSLVYLVVNHMEVPLCVSVLGSVRMYQLIELNLMSTIIKSNMSPSLCSFCVLVSLVLLVFLTTFLKISR